VNPELRILSQNEVEQTLARDHGLPKPAISLHQREQIVAEYLRHATCAFGRPSDGHSNTPFVPVHVNRLLAVVRKQLGFWLPPSLPAPWAVDEGDEENLELPDLARRSLQKLVFLRECAHTGNGYYLPTPTRLVELPVGGTLLLTGLPTHLAEETAGLKLWTAGLARIVHPRDLNKIQTRSLPSQAFTQWLGLPNLPLDAWTKQMLHSGTQRLRPSASESKFFTVYLPEFTRHTYQYYRWLPSHQWSGTQDRLYLCRSESHPRRYWLAQLQGKGESVHLEREAPVPPPLVRRLQYGLDLLAGAPVFARMSSHAKQLFTLSLQSWPAWEELRLLFALGLQTSVPHQFPIAFEFRQEWQPTIEHAIQSLGIDLRYESHDSSANTGNKTLRGPNPPTRGRSGASK
jgi:hypothetical protein